MLSTSPVKSSSKASEYFFAQDEYYFQDSIEQSWVGKGAAQLGLEGDVKIDQFRELLDGKLTNGQQLGRMAGGQLKHRPGYDLTFNAPKSVSLLAIMGQDKRLLKAHSMAVETALNTIEQRCTQARVTQDGTTQFQTTKNLAIATFRHELSRAGDPHLHTHCIVMNATECNDGKWRSLASNRDFSTQDRYGFWEQVIHHQRYYGLIYRAELAYQLGQLGYQIQKTGDHNFFEIAGVPQAAIDAFSQRRKAIEAYMAKQGKSGAKDAAFATLTTRQAKKAQNQDELNQLWRERATYHEFNPEQVIEQAKSGRDIIKEKEISDESKQMVIDAIDNLAHNRNIFSEQHIIQQVFSSQPKQLIRVNDLLTVIAELSHQNTLVALPGDKTTYTTQQLIDQEQALIKQAQDGKDALKPILPEQHLKLWLKRNPDCDAFEEKALLQIFTTKHQFQGVLGSNPDAQVRLIHHIKHLSILAEIQPVFLSPAQIRAKQLSQHYDMASFNIHQWVKTMSQAEGHQRLGSHSCQILLLVDEAQLLSLPQLHQLMRISQQTKSRVILFGDQNRLSSFSQTNALQLLDHHLPKMYLPKIKSADNNIAPSKGSLCDGKMNATDNPNIIAIEDQQSCTRQMARHYAAMQENHNGLVLIVMPSHAQSQTMNLAVRKALQDRNVLSKREYAIAIIQPNQDNKVSACSIAQGERVMWQSNQAKLGLVRGELLEVAQITSDKMTLRKADGKILERQIDSKHPLPLTYAYSLTPYRAVYQNSKIILAYQPSNHSQTNQQQLNHWKNLAQMVYIYTDDKARYLDNIARVHQKPLTVSEMMTTLQQQNEHGSPLKKALGYTVSHLSEREAVFDEHTLKTMMLEQTIGTVSPEKFDQLWGNELLPDAKENGLLLECKQDGKTFFTTPEALKLEQGIVELAKQGKGQYVPIAQAQSVQQFLEKSPLNPEQQQVIQLMMTHDHQFMLIQGIAGSGKTTTMSVAQSFLADQGRGYRLLGLAPTHQAVRVLTERGITAQTLQSYLSGYHPAQRHDGHQDDSKTILLLDEASMVSNRQMYDFLKSCHDTKTRAVIMGDTQQLPAIEAGKPFALLQTLDVSIANLKQTERYAKGSPLKSAVSAMHQEDVPQAFEALQQDFHEEKSTLESLTILAKQYLATPEDQRSNLQVITPSHHDRVLFNNIVRIGLKQQGELGADSVMVNVLVNRNLTQAEGTKASNYGIGDILKFHKSHGLPIEKGSYLKIAELVSKSNALVLIDQKEQLYYWQLPTLKLQRSLGVEVYRPERREISVGDQIHWMKTNSIKSPASSQPTVVTHIENDHRLQAKCSNGEIITLDLSNPEHLHFDHAYAGTAHALQGITVEKAHLSLRSDQRNLANQKTFLVAISRSTSNVGIYTDNRARLLERLTHNPGDKTSSIEVMGVSGKGKSHSVIVAHDDAKRLPNFVKLVTQTPSQYDCTTLIQDRLRQYLPSLLKKLMVEEPRRKTQQHYYYGRNKGSLAITISGQKQGLWYDFQTGEGGNVLQLVQMKLGLDFKQALDYVAQHLSLPQKGFKSPKEKSALPIPHISSKQKENFNQNEQDRIRYAQILYAQSKAITSTLAEQYLRAHRGIQGELPDSLRFHPHVYSKVNAAVAPALLAVAKNQQGQVQAVQAIFLSPDNATKANLPIQKQTFGVMKGASVTLRTKAHQASPFIFYAEGPETGLSILSVFPRAQVEVLLGAAQFKHIPHQQSASHIVLCLDNDKSNTSVSNIYHNIASSLTQAGKQVWFAKPSLPGSDFNDVLRRHGSLGVFQTVINAKPYSLMIAPGKEFSQLGDNMKNLSYQEAQIQIRQLIKLSDVRQPQKNHYIEQHHHPVRTHQLSLGSHQPSSPRITSQTQQKEGINKVAEQELHYEREH